MYRIKAVLDTNIIFSGIVSPKGSPRKLLELAKEETFKVVTSILINREILEVLHRGHIYTKYGLNEAIIDDIASFLYEGAILTEDSYEIMKVKRDPEDDKFINCAIEGEADYIVSGDGHLLDLKHYSGIQIINVNSFLRILQKA
ncbi:MAG: putative toxin-antitoxin system toxin component, PIN family [Proteobacteria bacterium]|nr:putative toxin-antitoxin system toxin component, PIN family [Pseudomonadota bacterium]